MTARVAAHAALGAVIGGLALLALHPVSRFYPVCPVYAYLHVLCPGCGATRALAALLRGDFVTAWRMNALFVCALPGMVVYALRCYRRAIAMALSPWPRVPSHLLAASVIASVTFAIVRNLPGMQP